MEAPISQTTLYHPEQATKLLPEAPVCVISPALWPLVLKITRSAPGDPTTHNQHNPPSSRRRHQLTTSVSTRSPQRELLVRSRNQKVEALVVVVRVGIAGTTGLAVRLVVRVALAACCRHLGAGVACRATCDEALPGLDLRLGLRDDGGREGKSDRSQEQEEAGDELHSERRVGWNEGWAWGCADLKLQELRTTRVFMLDGIRTDVAEAYTTDHTPNRLRRLPVLTQSISISV